MVHFSVPQFAIILSIIYVNFAKLFFQRCLLVEFAKRSNSIKCGLIADVTMTLHANCLEEPLARTNQERLSTQPRI